MGRARTKGRQRRAVCPPTGPVDGRAAGFGELLTHPPEVSTAGPSGASPAVVRPRDSTTTRVLLLNATHEPLAVVTGRRALVLLLAGKAECVAESGEPPLVHSPSLVMAVPAVVRLSRYVRIPYQPRMAISRAGVLRRDRRTCVYCGARAETIDHVQPRSRGGAHTWENCVACCSRCNARKADHLLSEIGWTLPFRPGPPARAGRGRVWLTDDTDPAWSPWLIGAA